MDRREVEDARKRELQAILDNIRFECIDLVDDYWIAFCASGRPMTDWRRLAEFEHEWFHAMNDEKLTFEERRGALKVVRAYLKSQIETLQIETMFRREGKHAAIRHT